MHGGKRKNAGRKPGAASAKTREIADKAAEEGITPLEVMLKAMRTSYEQGDLATAALFAKDAAPYIHPRLQAVELTGKGGGPIQHEANHTDLSKATQTYQQAMKDSQA